MIRPGFHSVEAANELVVGYLQLLLEICSRARRFRLAVFDFKQSMWLLIFNNLKVYLLTLLIANITKFEIAKSQHATVILAQFHTRVLKTMHPRQ